MRMLVGTLVLVLLTVTLPDAEASTFAAMEEVPVQGGELRLAVPIPLFAELEALEGGDVVPAGEAQVIAFPLEHTDVNVDVAGPMAQVQVEQTFANHFQQPVEAVYVFPLGQDAAVNGYEIVIGERVIRGAIREAQKARQEYERARDDGHTAALLEQEKPNVFSQAIANIPPGETVKVRISYVELLGYEDGGYELVVPTVVGPRYLPRSSRDPRPVSAHVAGRAARAGTASVPYVTPATRLGHDIDVAVRIDAGMPPAGLRSPSHRITQATDSATSSRVELAPDDRVPNKDFVLRWQTAGDATLVGLMTHRQGKEGYLTLVVQPKAEYRTGDITPREVILLIDRSGSMDGQPFQQARSVARGIISTLSDRDSFNVITFSDGVAQMRKNPQAASVTTRAEGLAYVDNMRSGGGTELGIGVARALMRDPGDDRVRMIYLITDGHIGNDDEILGAVQKRGGHNRMFSIGIGSSPNRYLLDRVAEVGRGFSSYIAPGEAPDEVVTRLVQKTTHPYITDLRVDWDGLDVREVTPATLPDVYAGKPLVISARYTKPGAATVRVSGRVAGRKVRIPLSVKLPKSEERPGVAHLWARRKIHELMGEDYGKTAAKVRAEVTALGLQFNLVTAYTSFVAVDDSRTVRRAHLARAVKQPAAYPDSMVWNGNFGGPAAPAVASSSPQPTLAQASPPPAPPSTGRKKRRWRGPKLRLPSGGGGDVDPVTLVTLIGLVPMARLLRRRRKDNG